ncbi:unnamed protein product [Urochloa decumbens]|uniref:F-box domain-containing protein n=1 Tax=Urochloa decumbens TaxID=240449 RepID=A0ABC9BY22_9POAL
MDTPSGKCTKAMDEGDRISGLPDEVRQHILSFLPASDVVRTCVLSPSWRHIWASARRLNIKAKGFSGQKRFIKFVNSLLLSRGCTPLDSFSLDANGPDIYLEHFCDTAYLWICYALRSNVQTLSITDHNRADAYKEFEDEEDQPDVFLLDHCPFTSSYLKRLHLCSVCVDKCFLKNLFSGCPGLEELDMMNCVIHATEFSSATLKKLSIDFNNFPERAEYGYIDIVINMPSLFSLHIGALLGAVASLVDVQSLITASIYLNTHRRYKFVHGCKILRALSNVKNLEVLFPHGVSWDNSMQSDMHLCGVVFTNLTTLSLSDWCLYDHCKPLLYLLEHSPNLEELTLKITQPMYHHSLDWHCRAASELDSPCVENADAFNCKNLEKIEILCQNSDKMVGLLVTLLLTKIVSPPQISITPSSHWANSYSWACFWELRS